MNGISSPVTGSNSGGSSSALPSSVTAAWGQMRGPEPEDIVVAPGDSLYLKATRTSTGDGAISGPVSIAGDVVSVSDGTNTASVTVSGFTDVGNTVVLVIETATDGVNGFMRVREVSNG